MYLVDQEQIELADTESGCGMDSRRRKKRPNLGHLSSNYMRRVLLLLVHTNDDNTGTVLSWYDRVDVNLNSLIKPSMGFVDSRRNFF